MGLTFLPWIISAFLAIGAFGYVVHCEKVKKDSAAFVAKMEQQASDQKRRNDEIEAHHKAIKEAADEDIKRRLANLNDTILRLRNAARTSASVVPAAPANASRPDLACFDRAELDRAFRERGEGLERYRAEVLGIAEEGSKATVALDGARQWALKLSTSLSQPQ